MEASLSSTAYAIVIGPLDNFAIARFLMCAQGAFVGVLWCGKERFKPNSV